MSIYQNIIAGRVTYSPHMRPAARELMQKLLVANPSKRLTFKTIKKEASAQTRMMAARRSLMPADTGFGPKNPSQSPAAPSSQRLDFDSHFSQPLFRAFDFDKLEKKELNPPWRPTLKGPTDLSYMPNASVQADEEQAEEALSGAGVPNGSLKEVGRLDAEFSQL